MRYCHCPVVVGWSFQFQSVDVIDISNIIAVFCQPVLCHRVPVVPGVGHVVQELEDPGQDGCQDEEWGGGGEGGGEAEEPDGASEPGGQLYDEVLVENRGSEWSKV